LQVLDLTRDLPDGRPGPAYCYALAMIVAGRVRLLETRGYRLHEVQLERPGSQAPYRIRILYGETCLPRPLLRRSEITYVCSHLDRTILPAGYYSVIEAGDPFTQTVRQEAPLDLGAGDCILTPDHTIWYREPWQ